MDVYLHAKKQIDTSTISWDIADLLFWSTLDLTTPTIKGWINMLPLYKSTHVEKSTLYITSFLTYCWFIILKYYIWPHPLEKTQPIRGLYGYLPIYKKWTSYINSFLSIGVSRILESDWSIAFWVITPKITNYHKTFCIVVRHYNKDVMRDATKITEVYYINNEFSQIGGQFWPILGV